MFPSSHRFLGALCLGLAVPLAALARAAEPATVAPAASAFDRLKALAGEWIDADGSTGMPGQVVLSYRVTGAGSAVVEILFPGSEHEMLTVYTREGGDIVLTHYCAMGNQPRMRARTVAGNSLVFEFDGGANLDPARDRHMHSGRIELTGADEIRNEWQSWAAGKPDEHVARFHVTRKAG